MVPRGPEQHLGVIKVRQGAQESESQVTRRQVSRVTVRLPLLLTCLLPLIWTRMLSMTS